MQAKGGTVHSYSPCNQRSLSSSCIERYESADAVGEDIRDFDVAGIPFIGPGKSRKFRNIG